ncbi:hypothetical protein Tco_1314255 [Tanacetum coccineum]
MLVLVTSEEARSSYMISKDAKSWVKSMIVKVVVKIGEASGSVQKGLEELAKRQKIGEEQLQQLMIIVPEEGINVEELTDDKAKELWVELKRLFEPDENDTLWKFQRYMHDPLTWKLYDTCVYREMT